MGYLRTYVNVAESRGCLRLLALLLAGSIAAGGCLTLDDVPARARWQYGPFAEELFGVWEQELGYSEPAALAPARVARLQRMEGEVLPALARTVEGPVGEEPGLLQLLHSPDALALWDDGTIDGLLGDAALLLERLERDGQPGLAAVAHLLEARGGHNPEGPWRLLHRLVRPPQPPLLAELSRLVAEHREPVAGLTDRAAQWLREQGEEGSEGGEGGEAGGGGGGAEGTEPLLWSKEVDDLLLGSGCGAFARRGLAPRAPDCRASGSFAQGSHEACLCDLEALRGAGPVFTVQVDRRGNPVVHRLPDGRLPLPFVDLDGDGEADVDGAGRHVDRDGRPIDIPALANPVPGGNSAEVHRNSQGMAQVALTTLPFYDYVELKGSLLGLAGHAARGLLLEPGAAGGTPLGDLLEVLPALLGPEIPLEQGAAYDAEKSPLLDLVHGLVVLLRYPRLQQLLDAVVRLVDERPELVERLVAELGRAAAILRAAPPILAEGSMLLDDLLGDNPFVALGPGSPCPVDREAGEACARPSWLRCEPGAPPRCALLPGRQGLPGILEELALEEGLLREVLRVVARDPALRKLPEATAVMVTHTGTELSSLDLDRASCDGYLAQGGLLPSMLLHRCWRELDRSASDDPQVGGLQGRSATQNLLALIYNTSRLAYDPLLAEIGGREVLPGELIIPNVAALYLDSTVGNARVQSATFGDEVLREAVGELMCELTLEDRDGNPLTPTSEQLNLWILRDHARFPPGSLHNIGNVVDHEGRESRVHYADMLVAIASRYPRGSEPCSALVDGQGQLPEAAGGPPFLLGLQPLVRAFSRHGMAPAERPRGMQEPAGRTQLLLDLLGTLHIHWGSYRQAAGCPLRRDLPGAGACSYRDDGLYGFDRQEGSGLRNLEPVLARLVRETSLLEVVLDVLAAGEGTGLNDELVPLLRWLLDRDAGERGEWRLRRPIAGGVPRGDHSSWDRRPARLYALLDPLRRLSRALDEPGQEAARQAWERLDLGPMLRGPADDGGLHRRVLGHLLREGLAGVALLLRPKLADERAREAWYAELDVLEHDLGRLVGEPALHELCALAGRLRRDERAREWLLALANSLLADPAGAGDDRRGALLEAVLHLGRLRTEPAVWRSAARGLAVLLEPASSPQGAPPAPQPRPLLDLLQRAGRLEPADPQDLLAALAANLLSEERNRPRSLVPLRTLLAALARTMQRQPLSEEPLAREDLLWLVHKARLFLVDQEHGVARLGKLVRQRGGKQR